MAYFKALFSPSQDSIWTSRREQIAGEIIPGSVWSGDRLQVGAGDWTVTLDEYPTTIMVDAVRVPIQHTRMRAPFPNPSGFRFSIHRASIFSYLGTLLGMQDIQVGYPEFDEAFVIKGKNEPAVQSLCSSHRLRALVTAQRKFQLSIQDDEGWFGKQYPPTVDVLVFDVAEQIRDVERLKGIYDVFAETLHRLSEMGLADRGTGGVTV